MALLIVVWSIGVLVTKGSGRYGSGGSKSCWPHSGSGARVGLLGSESVGKRPSPTRLENSISRSESTGGLEETSLLLQARLREHVLFEASEMVGGIAKATILTQDSNVQPLSLGVTEVR